jgi:hypothetical protein
MSIFDWIALITIGIYSRLLSLLQHLGTPLHELCHFAAASLAGLRVSEFVPYYALSKDRDALKAQGIMGYVKHERAADEAVNIIVGASPLLALCFVILAADACLADMYGKALVSIAAIVFLTPSRKDTFEDFSDAGATLMNIPLILFIRLVGMLFSSNVVIVMAFHAILAIAVLLFVISMKTLVVAFLLASLLTLLSYRMANGALLFLSKMLFYLTFPLSTLFWAACAISYCFVGTDYFSAIIGYAHDIWS